MWFQSTPSVKRATSFLINVPVWLMHFNPHPLWRGRQCSGGHPEWHICDFNPHPLWRGRPSSFSHWLYSSNFNPHPLWRGRRFATSRQSKNTNFNPHPLWRGRLILLPAMATKFLFQSTPSVKRATRLPSMPYLDNIISIHTLCEEGDSISCANIHLNAGISIHTLCEEGDH